MPNRGVLFAVTDDIANKLINLPVEKRVGYIEKDIEEMFFENDAEHTFELDKAWDTIHRVLTDGCLHWDNGEYPLSHAILGGDVLYGMESTDDYLIVLKTSDEVTDINDALKEITDADFKKGYALIDINDYEYRLGFEDMQYAAGYFEEMRSFWEKAARDNRAVIFTVDL